MHDDRNLTLRIDAQVLLWTRMRALRDGTSINRRIRRYLEEHAAIPADQRWHAAAWPDADPGAAGNRVRRQTMHTWRDATGTACHRG